ncbi:MBL fold metallo-hydrolase [Vulgatibacter sp.]|uniref:MBL fold metallo-hydrolase n=1 Tax=Vulgatibacter sp. TaxID=1971226 RepID=UPI00356B1121
MRVHHLNCASFCPFGGRLVDGSGRVLRAAQVVTHTLLVETGEGLVLVDTGLGLQDVAHPHDRLGGFSLRLLRPSLSQAETAVRQVEWLGFRREDVRHVVLTHLDLDHAGGLPDFPAATVHVYGPELHAATIRATARERERYRPAHWAHGPRWRTYEVHGDRWFGFEAVQALEGLPPEILLVPLPGHTRGHCGVAVRSGAGWILHAGDAYFFHGEVHEAARRCPPALSLFQRLVEIDPVARRHNQDRLRQLVRHHAGEVRVFSAHDPAELAWAQAAD